MADGLIVEAIASMRAIDAKGMREAKRVRVYWCFVGNGEMRQCNNYFTEGGRCRWDLNLASAQDSDSIKLGLFVPYAANRRQPGLVRTKLC